ncbi:MAG: hypothetical protein PHQ60_04560 [Sideroxydans sp.]|nr:hypothetical protein [Sideroxydans sp.]
MKNMIALLVLAMLAGTAAAESKRQTHVFNPHVSKVTNTGTVLEVIDKSSMYTFLQVSGDKGKLWLATNKTDVAKGNTVRYSDGVEMKNFYSKSLNRTFDTITFVDVVTAVNLTLPRQSNPGK